jgi:outer membrane lipoprotein-sorting protein
MAQPQNKTQRLDQILDKLDAASAHFKNATADVSYDNYTKAAHADDISNGMFFIERTDKGQTIGLVLIEQGAKQPTMIVNFDGSLLQRYTPGSNQDDLFKAGANQAKIDSFLALGFGGSGKDLKGAWDITDKGQEIVGRVNCEVLDLVSKDAGVRNMFSHVTIWVDLDHGIKMKQVMYASTSGDVQTTVYSNIKLGVHIDKKPFTIPSKAVKVVH